MSEIGEYEVSVVRGHIGEQVYYTDSTCHRKLTASLPETLSDCFWPKEIKTERDPMRKSLLLPIYAMVGWLERKCRQYMEMMIKTGDQQTYCT